MASSTELAWAAGFWDGEGCSYTNTSKGRKYLRLTASQHEPTTLQRFANAVGLGNVTGPYQSKKYSWHVSGQKASDVMDLLWPYLSEPKKQQFLEKRSTIG